MSGNLRRFEVLLPLEFNLMNTAHRSSLYGILGIGVAFVIITGGIDLSIGSVVGLVGCLLPWLIIEHAICRTETRRAPTGLDRPTGHEGQFLAPHCG